MREDVKGLKVFYEKKFDSEAFRRGVLIGCAIRGMHPVDIVDKLGLTRNSIARWMCGYHKPRFETVEKIAKILRVPMGLILGCYPVGCKKNDRFIELKGD